MLAHARATFEQTFFARLEALGTQTADRLLARAHLAQATGERDLLMAAYRACAARQPHLRAAVARHAGHLIDRALHTSYRWESHTVAGATRLARPAATAIGARLALEARIALLRRTAAGELDELNLRLAYLHGETRAQERENPFRPYVLVNAVTLGVGSLGLLPELAHAIVREMVESLSHDAAPLYQAVNTVLGARETLGRRPRHRAIRSGQRHPAANAAARQPSNLLGRWLQLKVRPERLQAEPVGQHKVVAYTTYSGSTLLARAVEKLTHSAANKPEHELRNHVLDKRVHLAGFTKCEAEQTVIDTVAVLYEHVLRDGQVPTNIRAVLGKTQFILLKFGLFYPQPFLQRQHPARTLLDRLRAAAAHTRQYGGTAQVVERMIRSTVDTLCSARRIDAVLFAQALAQFDETIRNLGVQLQPSRPAAAQGSDDPQLAGVLHHFNVDEQIAIFLSRTWAPILHQASAQIPAEYDRLSAVAPVLAWSVLSKQRLDQRAKLFAQLPSLIANLTAGLDVPGLSTAGGHAFKHWLLEAHLAALQLEHAGATFDLATIKAAFAIIHQCEVDMQERCEAQPTYIPSTNTSCTQHHDTVITRLRAGIAVDYVLGDMPRRARLSWINQVASSIRLSIEEVAIPSALSVGLLLRLIARGQIRFINCEPWFERSLTALLRSAADAERQAMPLLRPV